MKIQFSERIWISWLIGLGVLVFSSILGMPDIYSQTMEIETNEDGNGEYYIYLPLVNKPFAVNTTLDGADANPGDGYCETAPGNQLCTLRAIIQETNALPGVNAVFLPAGNYSLTIPGGSEDFGATGDLDITDELTIVGTGSSSVIINGNRLDRVFHILGVPTNISGITIMNGEAQGFDGGGGIFNGYGDGGYVAPLTLDSVVIKENLSPGQFSCSDCSGGGVLSVGSLTVLDSLVTDNEASYKSGGGIASRVTTIQNSTITNNMAGQSGGGISADSLTLINSVVENNTIINQGSSNKGGGISMGSSSLIENSIIGNNTLSEGKGAGIAIESNSTNTTTNIRNSIVYNNATTSNQGASSANGGGIYNYNGILVILNSQIMGNYAAFQGGGIYNDSNAFGGEVRIRQSTISANVAEDRGGGIYNGLTMSLENVTVSGNRADGSLTQLGGAIYSKSSTTIINSTIYGNQADDGGGIAQEAGAVSIKNSILAGNMALYEPASNNTDNCYGFVVSAGYNLEDGVYCNFTAVGDRAQTNPKLGPLQLNGGSTTTHALLAGSPAIDAGTNVGCPAIDQRGIIRPKDGNGDSVAICDIGAYEYP
jgi:hypothetical protein